MPPRSCPGSPEKYRVKLIKLLENFQRHLENGDLREQVTALIPAADIFRNLGASLLCAASDAGNARQRILIYLKTYPNVVLDGRELMIVAGISEYARRVRELRVQFGWKILTGVTLKNMDIEELSALFRNTTPRIKPDQYILVSLEQDEKAAYRWHVANDIRRRKDLSVRDKILKYLRTFVGMQITGEELRYVAGNKTEWARRTRELRTELGWPVATKFTARPDLPIGIYILEEDRQGPEHDRHIPEAVYKAVFRRDNYTCNNCGWNYTLFDQDHRHLEAHHIIAHAKGGSNDVDNLITLCNVCHDVVHRKTS